MEKQHKKLGPMSMIVFMLTTIGVFGGLIYVLLTAEKIGSDEEI